MLILTLLPIAIGANANCVTDAPEIGDIGPGSDLVCNALESRFPGAALAVEGRAIHSPTEVTVTASVDGDPVSLRYELTGYTWRLDGSDARVATVPTP
jgi:hypothetical protein